MKRQRPHRKPASQPAPALMSTKLWLMRPCAVERRQNHRDIEKSQEKSKRPQNTLPVWRAINKKKYAQKKPQRNRQNWRERERLAAEHACYHHAHTGTSLGPRENVAHWGEREGEGIIKLEICLRSAVAAAGASGNKFQLSPPPWHIAELTSSCCC